MSKKKDEIGNIYGRLLVIEEAGRDRHGKSLWRCLCKCGGEVVVVGCSLRRTGHTRSCGCLIKDILKERGSHGQAVHGNRTSNYFRWNNIKQKCFNPNRPDYKYYGGRGITMEEEWIDDFAAFDDYINENLGPRPSPQHSVDRRDNEFGSYVKGNLRWATPREQARNRRKNLLYKGKPMAHWVEKTGLSYGTIYSRVYDLGWGWEKALTTPAKKRNLKKKEF